VADAACTFAVLSRSRLLDLIRAEPPVAIALLVSLADRLRNATEREERLAFLDVRARLCRFFAQAALREGRRQEDGSFLVGRRTHRDLAAHIGSSRESVTKALKSLARERLLGETGDAIRVSPEICGPPGEG
jgi:CRP-like cAMP-binding protein